LAIGSALSRVAQTAFLFNVEDPASQFPAAPQGREPEPSAPTVIAKESAAIVNDSPQPARRLVSVSQLVCDYAFLPFGSICAPESIIGAAPLSDQRFDEPIL
jgi:hypothetical protein